MQFDGRTLRQFREARDWTVPHLEDVSGVGRYAIYAYEHGRCIPSANALKALADALNVKIEKFYTEEVGS